MGAGASVPDKIDLETAKTLAGDKFDEAKFFPIDRSATDLGAQWKRGRRRVVDL